MIIKNVERDAKKKKALQHKCQTDRHRESICEREVVNVKATP